MRYRIVSVAALAMLALAGCGAASGSSSNDHSGVTSRDLVVQFELNDPDGGSTCSGGRGGYSDISTSTPVVVSDGTGHKLATVPLGSTCEPTDVGDFQWTTTVPNVPLGKKSYTVEVGSRGAMAYSEDQLNQKGWGVHVSLGVA